MYWFWMMIYVGLFVFVIFIVPWLDSKFTERDRRKSDLQKAAAAYDRLRDEEFRELGWTGKH
ncbi:MAG TPA: hypothetical protein ENH82_16375 [bacterium]|nr:hypothetical protein [bacterium]